MNASRTNTLRGEEYALASSDFGYAFELVRRASNIIGILFE